MTRTPRRSGNVRPFLVIAALVHLLGGELGAWLHRNDAPPAHATVFAPGSDGDRLPPPGHPRDCAVCQTLGDGAHALPATGMVMRAGVERGAPGIGSAWPPARSRPGAPSLPRGPPAHS